MFNCKSKDKRFKTIQKYSYKLSLQGFVKRYWLPTALLRLTTTCLFEFIIIHILATIFVFRFYYINTDPTMKRFI